VIVAAHQPHYLPWLGYLDKLAGADVFVVMDDLQYEAQNFINRQRVKLNAGPHWLVVPLERGAQTDRICDRRIDNAGRGGRHHWQHRHWRTLVTHYGASPHWNSYAPALEDIYTRRWDYLLDLDLHVLDLARRWFGITRPIVRASSLDLRGAQKWSRPDSLGATRKTERIIAMCHALGARTYLTGKGGSAGYLDVDALARAGVATVWQSFAHPTYPQRYPHLGFASHLGFLDFLCNAGSPTATKELRHESSAR